MNFLQNVFIYVFHINLALICLVLHGYMASFLPPREVADFTDVILTMVKPLVLQNVDFS